MMTRKRRRWISRAAAVLGISGAAALALDAAFPPPRLDDSNLSRILLAEDGTILRVATTMDGKIRLATRATDVDPRFIRLLVAYEDRRFYSHPGVDPVALLRAAWQGVSNGKVVSGASTLTMQVARLLEPRPRTVRAKAIETMRALQLEARLSKDEILGLYLTLAPYGGNLEGLRAASLAWLGKEPGRLTDAEAALLVVLPQAPSRLRPDRHPQRARAARDMAEWLVERVGDINVIDVINMKDEYGNTLLLHAANYDALEMAEWLVERGADIDAKTKKGYTPLHRAAADSTEILKLLIDRGADIHAKSKHGWTPLHWAVQTNSLERVKLLVGRGADIRAKDDGGETPLHEAARSNARETAEWLVGRGADINAKDKYGNTPLDMTIASAKGTAQERAATAALLRRLGGRRGASLQ